MSAGNLFNIKRKLIKALNSRGYMIMSTSREFMGVEGIPHIYYIVTRAEWDDERKRYDTKELYGSTSIINVVMYLRDLWYMENDMELPTDFEKWNSIRESLIEKGNWAYGCDWTRHIENIEDGRC